jgi:hypothetical protein
VAPSLISGFVVHLQARDKRPPFSTSKSSKLTSLMGWVGAWPTMVLIERMSAVLLGAVALLGTAGATTHSVKGSDEAAGALQ